MIVGIYGLFCRPSGKWYVGQSLDVHSRWRKYKRCACKTQLKLYNALKKYGYDSFDKTVIETCENIDWLLDYREMYWIRHLDSMNNGYNLTQGGGGCRGRVVGDREKALKRLKLKGRKRTSAEIDAIRAGTLRAMQRSDVITKLKTQVRPPLSDEHRVKIRLSSLGRKHTSESRKRMSIVQTGHPCSAETKRKISETKRRHKTISEYG